MEYLIVFTVAAMMIGYVWIMSLSAERMRAQTAHTSTVVVIPNGLRLLRPHRHQPASFSSG